MKTNRIIIILVVIIVILGFFIFYPSENTVNKNKDIKIKTSEVYKYLLDAKTLSDIIGLNKEDSTIEITFYDNKDKGSKFSWQIEDNKRDYFGEIIVSEYKKNTYVLYEVYFDRDKKNKILWEVFITPNKDSTVTNLNWKINYKSSLIFKYYSEKLSKKELIKYFNNLEKAFKIID